MATSAPPRSRASFIRLSQIGEWTKGEQGRARKHALTVDLVTTVVQTTLSNGAAKNGVMAKAIANLRARRAVRNYRRAAAHLDAAADCMGRGWHDIQREFADLINPQAKNAQFNWQK